MTNSEIVSTDLKPIPSLARLGIRYRAFDERSREPVRRFEAAGDGPVMIVSIGPPVSIGAAHRSPVAAPAFCVGIGSHALVSEHAGCLRCVEVSAPALLAARLWPGLSSALNEISLHELWRPAAVDAIRQAADQGDLVEVAARLDTALSLVLAERSDTLDAVAIAVWRGLIATAGRARIGQLAAAIGVSERHAIAKFRAAAGVTPKMAARRLRFVEARRLMLGGDQLAEIAAACGYADQSHFTREFAMFAGEPPGRRRAG